MSGNIVICMADAPTRATARAWLEEEAYTVHVASTIEDGLELIDRLKPNVVLVDLKIDPTEGLDGVRVLRAATSMPIMVVGEDECDARPLRALDLGADDYICRTPDEDIPLARKELLSRLGVALRRSGEIDETVGEIVAGTIRIHLDTRKVSVDGADIRLTPNEFKLLVCLAAKPERVFTHQELLSQIWGARAAKRVNYLHVYVDRLRKRIEPDPTTPRRLLSVRGVGYRLALPED